MEKKGGQKSGSSKDRDPKAGEWEAAPWKVIIAGGGTGGHLFPGVAVGEEISRRRRNSEILFVTGRRKMESSILERAGFQHAAITVEGIKGRGRIRGVAVILKLPLALVQSILLIKKFSPDIVLGVGGYSSGPVCLSARIMGRPSAVHEQNSYPGLTNRLLCKVVDKVFISFEESREHFPGGSLFFTGNPVRRALLNVQRVSVGERKDFTLLAMGGSQGARAVNDVLPEALEILQGRGIRIRVIHQTGAGDFPRVRETYEQKGLEVEVMPFIQDMGWAYAAADMVLGRAGATTISELAALGLPSILVPYPYAANRHQETNALMLARIGGAEMILEESLNGRKIADLLVKYKNDRTALEEMGRRAAGAGSRNAAKMIVDHMEALIG